MRVQRLETVDAMIAFDFDCRVSAGGTRLAPDVSEAEVRLLARAMTYKLAVLEMRIGGAKAVIRARAEERDGAVGRYCQEVLPLVREQRFLTGTDLGTFPEDLAPLHEREDGPPPDLQYAATGISVVAAAGAALGGLEGATVALEGFGKIGAGTSAAVRARGGRLVAVSTVHGCVRKAEGFDVDGLLELRGRHGDRFVEHVGAEVLPPPALYETEADVLVPGARTGTLDADRAARVRARVVAPAANVPYTEAGLRVLRERGVVALADFVCSSGATLSYVTPGGDVLDAVERRVDALTREAMRHESGPFAGAAALAEEFLAGWMDPAQLPVSPPLA